MLDNSKTKTDREREKNKQRLTITNEETERRHEQTHNEQGDREFLRDLVLGLVLEHEALKRFRSAVDFLLKVRIVDENHNNAAHHRRLLEHELVEVKLLSVEHPQRELVPDQHRRVVERQQREHNAKHVHLHLSQDESVRVCACERRMRTRHKFRDF